MLAALGLPSEAMQLVLGFVTIKLVLIGVILYWVNRKLPALFRGLRRGASELRDGLNDGLSGGRRP